MNKEKGKENTKRKTKILMNKEADRQKDSQQASLPAKQTNYLTNKPTWCLAISRHSTAGVSAWEDRGNHR